MPRVASPVLHLEQIVLCVALVPLHLPPAVGAEKPAERRKRAACSAARVLGGVPFADASCSARRRAASTPGWCLRSARTVSAHELQ